MPENTYILPGDLWETEREKYIPPGDLRELEREAALKFPADKTNQRQSEPLPEGTDDRPLLVKLAGRIFPHEKSRDRFKITPYADQQKLNEETFSRTHGDVFRERFGESHPAYQRLMQMGDSLDKEHNLPFGTPIMGVIPTPTGLYNKYHKEKLRDAFDDIDIRRKY